MTPISRAIAATKTQWKNRHPSPPLTDSAGRIRALVAEHDQAAAKLATATRVTINRGDGWTIAALA